MTIDCNSYLNEAHYFDGHLQRYGNQIVEQNDECQQIVAEIGSRHICKFIQNQFRKNKEIKNPNEYSKKFDN